MKLHSLALTFAIALTPTLAAAGPDVTAAKTEIKAQLSASEQKAIVHDHHVNGMEIAMGNLAKKQATAPVKKYGAMLVTEHTKADREYTALAKKKGMAKIPEEMPTTDAEKAEHAKMGEAMAKLKALKGAAFDALYLELMVAGHDQEIALNVAAQASATDADVKAQLTKRNASLQKHADAARALQTKAAAAATK